MLGGGGGVFGTGGPEPSSSCAKESLDHAKVDNQQGLTAEQDPPSTVLRLD